MNKFTSFVTIVTMEYDKKLEKSATHLARQSFYEFHRTLVITNKT